jgi:GH15 family glucan-1,4-alpha-glucosidase
MGAASANDATGGERPTPRIQEYAIIGDCRAAALVSRDGSIDWLCWPRFDSPSVFGAILDRSAGHWRIAPTGPLQAERRYLPETNVLETTFRTETGTLVLTDLMPVGSEPEKRAALTPEHEVLRILECTAGTAVIEMVFEPRPDYGRAVPRFRDAGELGLRVETSAGLLVLRTDLPLRPARDGRVTGQAALSAGQALHFSLTLADQWPAVLPPLGDWSRAALVRSVAWWRGWSSALRYEGPARPAVVRSALVLKLLIYAPSGAIVAAPTTSLPERLQGDLNWDYRYCWLRDASLTVGALFGLGFHEDAAGFVDWLLHSTRLTQPALRILYDVHGNRPRPEITLDHLAGHAGSRPVRVGNAAAEQLQLDIYGEVVDATAQLARRSGSLDREVQRMLCAFGEYVCRNWQRPDEGIWEPRSGRGPNTHSRLLCWTALDRLLQLRDQGLLQRGPFDRFARTRDLIGEEIRLRAWNPLLQSYVARLDGDQVDATLLLIPWYGFEEASSERMVKTHARIRRQLGAANGLLYRYRTGDSPGEGAFGICGFWAAEYLALGGDTAQEAQALFERLCARANDVGLFAEEIDPATGDALGNFPQAFTHVGLINAAISLSRRQRQESAVPDGQAWGAAP